MSKGWYGNKQAHSLASKGVKTKIVESFTLNQDKKSDLKNWYYVTFLDRITAYDLEEFYEDMDERGMLDGMNVDEWIENEIEERLMNYPEVVDVLKIGDGMIRITGKIYFRADNKEDAINHGLEYDFQSYDVYNAKTDKKILDEVEVY